MKIGDKITLKKESLIGEVIGVYPAGQAGQARARYSVMINGKAEVLGEEMIELLFDKYEPKAPILQSSLSVSESEVTLEITVNPEPKKEEKKANAKSSRKNKA